ncbi:MAG TPA: alpha/beta hydrolase [Solirubrobacteraceae bacterium]|nr:alpha/beta hydrolase [Solirubrobacteraceae bacterium]
MRLEDLPPVPGVEHRFVTAGGSRLHFAEAGSGEPILMLHGWPQHWYLWRDVIPRLAPGHRLVCPDLPGFGWSDPPARGYAKEELAGQLLALMDELGLERVQLVGHDWGGWIGFLMCLRAPGRFSRFLAIDAPHPFQRPSARRMLGLWRLWYQPIIAAPVLGQLALRHGRFHTQIMKGAVGPGFRWPKDVLEAFTAPLREPAGARASVALYRSFVVRELWPVAAGRYRGQRLQVPTFLLAGAHDPAIRKEVLQSDGDQPELRGMELVPGVGHFLVDERPELVVERVLAAWDRDVSADPAQTQPEIRVSE